MKHKIMHVSLIIGCLFLLWNLLPSALLAGESNDPDDATCLGCHDGYDKTLVNSPHRLGSQIKSPTVKVACVSCHAGGENHAADPSASNITNPSRKQGNDAIEICAKCHVAHREMDNFGFDAHTNAQLNCAECHKVHGTKKSLLLDDKAEFCLKCHKGVETSFMKRSNHPVRQGDLTCLSCHIMTKRLDDKHAYDANRVCQDCHPDQSGPFPHEHAAVNAYPVNGNGCVECHDPHGSVNDKLLKQPAKQLCKQCHSVPTHATAHGGVYAQYDCLTCHSEVHGSYNSQLLLDPELYTKLGQACSVCHIRAN